MRWEVVERLSDLLSSDMLPVLATGHLRRLPAWRPRLPAPVTCSLTAVASPQPKRWTKPACLRPAHARRTQRAHLRHAARNGDRHGKPVRSGARLPVGACRRRLDRDRARNGRPRLRSARIRLRLEEWPQRRRRDFSETHGYRAGDRAGERRRASPRRALNVLGRGERRLPRSHAAGGRAAGAPRQRSLGKPSRLLAKRRDRRLRIRHRIAGGRRRHDRAGPPRGQRAVGAPPDASRCARRKWRELRGRLRSAATFLAQIRERAFPAGFAGEANDDGGSSTPDGIKRLLPMAGTCSLVVLIEFLTAANLSAPRTATASAMPCNPSWRCFATACPRMARSRSA